MAKLEWEIDLLVDYYTHRPNMGNGDLIEFSTHSMMGSAIRYFTKKDVNHTAILWCVDEFKDVKDRKFIMEALENGIELNLLSIRLTKYQGDVYWYKLKDEFNDHRDRVASNCLLAEGRTDEIKYDYISLIKNMWKKVSVDVEKNSFCSEFAQYVLQSSGIIPRLDKALRPGEFDSLGIYEPRVRIYSWRP